MSDEPMSAVLPPEDTVSRSADVGSCGNWPMLNKAAFYGVAGDIVQAITPHTEADPAGLLAHFLSEFSCLIGRGPSVELDASPSTLSFWPVLVGDTGKARKGTSDKRIGQVFKDACPEWTRGEGHGGTLSTGEGLVFAVRDARELQNGETDPGVSDKRLYAVQTEFGSMLTLMAREGNSLSGIIRNAWDGEDLVILTKNFPIRATRPHIVIAGHVTKEELRGCLKEKDRFNGFGNRFVWCAVRRSRLLPHGGKVPESVMNPLVARLKEAVGFANTISAVGLTAEGQLLWEEMYAYLAEAKPGTIGALLGRGEAHIRRIAALYALLDQQSRVNEAHLKAAVALWEYSDESVAWIFDGSAGKDDLDHKILWAVCRCGELNDSQISGLFNRNFKADRLNQSKERLAKDGVLHAEERETAGRTSRIWRPGPQAGT